MFAEFLLLFDVLRFPDSGSTSFRLLLSLNHLFSVRPPSGFSMCAAGAFGSTCLPCIPGSFCPAGVYHRHAFVDSLIESVFHARGVLDLQESCRRCRVRSGLPATRRPWHSPYRVPLGALLRPYEHQRFMSSSGRGFQSCCLLFYTSSFGNATGLVACLPCQRGTFNGMSGQSSAAACLACGVGTFNDQTGKSSAAACLPCSVGTFNAVTGRSVCLACSAGTFASRTGQSTCVPCGTGTFPSAQTGLSACPACLAGTFCPDGATPPLPCPIGFVCPGPGLSFPQLCGGGQGYCPVSNLTSPLPCPGGNMSTPGASGCVAAVVTTFAGGFNGPTSLVVDAGGNFLVADTSSMFVRSVTPRGGSLLRE